MSGSKMPVKKHIRRAFWHAGAELSCFPRAVNGSSKIDLIVQMNPNGFQWLSADRKISGPARLKPAPTVMLWCPSRHGRPCCDRNLRPCTEVVNFTSEVTHLDEVSVSWMGTWENTGLSRFRLNGKHGKHGKPWTRFELTMFFQFFFFFFRKSLSFSNSCQFASGMLQRKPFWELYDVSLWRASWCFDASGWDANQRGDSKGWTSLWSVLIRFGFGDSEDLRWRRRKRSVKSLLAKPCEAENDENEKRMSNLSKVLWKVWQVLGAETEMLQGGQRLQLPGLTTSEDIRSLAREIVEKSLAQSHAEVTQDIKWNQLTHGSGAFFHDTDAGKDLKISPVQICVWMHALCEANHLKLGS
jgi:hypothetical protein